AAAGQAETDDADSLVAASDAIGWVGGHEPGHVAFQQPSLLDAGRDIRVEAAGLGVGGDRLVEQAGVAARVHESREELGVVAVPRGLAQETYDGFARPAGVSLEVRIELVRD